MIDNKNYKICEKVFSLKELEEINQFVIKKLNVGDLYKVRDRFEGNLFLINTLKRIFLLHTFLSFLEIKDHERLKIGFLNTINLEAYLLCKVVFIDYENDINNFLLNTHTLYCYINSRSRLCIIFSKDLEIKNIQRNIIENLSNIKSKLIYI